MRFEGYLKVPADGRYTFHLGSDDGSFLYLAGEQLIDNDGGHPMTFKEASTQLTRGSLPIKVTFAQGSGASGLKLQWEGPNIDKQDVPAKNLAHAPGGTR